MVAIDWGIDCVGACKHPAIHHSMLSRVQGTIQEVVKGGRSKVEPRPRRTFHLMSPFVTFARTHRLSWHRSKMSEVSPFWAVLQCLNSKSANNMQLTKEEYPLDQSFFKGCVRPNKQTVISLPVLRNIADIKQGDILIVPYMPVEDDA